MLSIERRRRNVSSLRRRNFTQQQSSRGKGRRGGRGDNTPEIEMDSSLATQNKSNGDEDIRLEFLSTIKTILPRSRSG